MAGNKMLVSMTLFVAGASAITTPVDPCAPPTKAPNSCASFACPKSTTPKAGAILCGNAKGMFANDKCSSVRCCDVVSTVTTTPKLPCSTITTTPGTSVTTTPAATVTTTAKLPCSTITTTPGTTVTTTPAATVTTTAKLPCSTITTTPGTTVTTTPAATVTTTAKLPCSTITTTPGATKTTTPAATVTTTPAPTTVNPCAPVAPAAPARLYNAKEARVMQRLPKGKVAASPMQAWAFPLFGVLGMFSFAVAFFAVRFRQNRSTRQFQYVDPADLESTDNEDLLLE